MSHYSQRGCSCWTCTGRQGVLTCARVKAINQNVAVRMNVKAFLRDHQEKSETVKPQQQAKRR